MERLRISLPRASSIRSKIVFPYLVLALLVAVLGGFVAAYTIGSSLQERLEQRLRQSALHTSQGLVEFEDQQLSKLRLIALASRNPEERLLSTVEALRRGESNQLDQILRNGIDYYQLSQLIVFDLEGQVLAEQLSPQYAGQLPSLHNSSLTSLRGVQYVLSRRRDSIDGQAADKFSGTTLLQSADKAVPVFYTVVPIRRLDIATDEEELLGGILAVEPLQRVVELLHRRNDAFYTVIYDSSGQAITSNRPAANTDLAIPADTLAVLRSQAGTGRAVSSVSINRRNVSFMYSPLRIRDHIDGYFAVALEMDTFYEDWQPTKQLIIGLTLLLLTGVVGLGHFIARRITLPLQELAQTAQAIAQGQLGKRGRVRTNDEVGMLTRVLNDMADRLIDLHYITRKLAAELRVEDILLASSSAIRRLLPETRVALVYTEQGHWFLRSPESATPRPLASFNIHEANRLPIFAEARVLGQALAIQELGTFDPKWVLPLRSQQGTLGLLLIGGVPANVSVEPIYETLVAIATMAATSLQNGLLYIKTEQEASQNRAILESIADGVIVCDTAGRIILVNNAASVMIDRSIDQLYKMTFAELPLRPLERKGELFSNVHDPQQLYEINRRTLSLSSSPVVVSQGGQIGQVYILHDVTRQVEVDRAKTELIDTISHDLRTPLTPIQGYLDLLLQPDVSGELTESQRTFIEAIQQHAQIMNNLLNNAILLARIEAGTMQPSLQSVSAATIIDDAVAPLRQSFEAKGLRIEVNVRRNLPAIRGDPAHLLIALAQILDNAGRYTDAGTIMITAAQYNNFIQIDVTDTGQGISIADQRHIFNRLNRGGEVAGAARSKRGAGLGLSIARQLVEQQGGSIWVSSRPGKGSTFSIRLHSMRADDEQPPEAQSINAAMA